MSRQGAHSKCQDSDACHGPGCNRHTGKTARKANWARSKPNKHEAAR